MKIIIISKSWPSDERSGVSLAAHQHAQILLDKGHNLSIVGSSELISDEPLNLTNKFYVESRGSGSLYSKAKVNKFCLRDIFNKIQPDLVIVEGWQTALTDSAIDVANDLKLPLLVVSHGVSLHPFSYRFTDIARSILWFYYRFRLIKRISKLKIITTLDLTAISKRFYDREIATKKSVTVVSLVNSPVNFCSSVFSRSERKNQIIVVGYFSYIKNQLAAIEVFSQLSKDLKMVFVGPKKGRYYKKCLDLVIKKGLELRVSFYDDEECNIAEEISRSLVMLCTSITEVLPISILEAMASRTPYVAPEIGAIPSLRSGIIANDINSQKEAIERLVKDEIFWNDISCRGASEYAARFTLENVSNQLMNAVLEASSKKSTND